MGIEIDCRLILGIDDQRIGGAWRAPSSNATFCKALILAFTPVVLLGLIPPWDWKAGVGWVPVSAVAARAGASGQHNFNRVWPGPELWPGYAVTGQYGHSKDVRGADRQVAVGVVQTATGLPLTHEVFEGNVGEVTTVQGIVARLGQRFRLRRVVFVADRGMLSLDTLDQLEGLLLPGGRTVEYIIAVPARRCTQVTVGLSTLHPRLVKASRRSRAESVAETALEGQRRLVVAHDPERAQPTRRQRAERIREVLALAHALEAKLDAQDAGAKGKGRRLTDANAPLFCWHWHQAAFRQAWQRDGKLVLITNVPELPAADVVAHYKSLADIERGFRVLKSDLELAPVYHRLPERIRAHTSICFLALVLQRVLRQRLHQCQWPDSPQRTLAQLRTVQRHRVRLPNGQILTGISPLTDTQHALLEALHIEIPTEARLSTAM